MALITWTKDDFGTTIKAHDEEHKHLFDLLNVFHDKVVTGVRSEIGPALDALIAFVAEHFASEEKNMAAAGYDGLAAHQQQHRQLVDTCVELQQAFHSAGKDITTDTTGFLRDWLIHHIPKVDFNYGPAMLAKGLG